MEIQVLRERVVFEVSENIDAANSILISVVFEDYFSHRYWLNESLQPKVGVQINGKEIPQSNIKEVSSEPDQVILMVTILESINPDSSLLLNVTDNSFSISEAPMMAFEEEMKGTLPFVAYYSESEIQVLEQMNQTSASVIRNLGSSSNGFSLLGATYLISSLFTFMNVILLFNFLRLKWVLTPYKLLFNTIVTIFYQADSINNFLNTFFGVEISVKPSQQMPESIEPSAEIPGMREHGFSSQFLPNSWN